MPLRRARPAWMAALVGCLLLLLAGCGNAPRGTPSAAPSPSAKAPKAVVASFTIKPSTGPAGSKVTLGLVLGKGSSFTREPAGGRVAQICWGSCKQIDRWYPAIFHKTAEGTYQAMAIVPSLVAGNLLPAGTYTVRLACVHQLKSCTSHPEATASFRVTAPLSVSTVGWTELHTGIIQRLAPLAPQYQAAAVDPADPARSVQCRGGMVSAGQAGEATLVVSGPDPLRAVVSVKVLGDAHGFVGCRALALDPRAPNTIYTAGIDDLGANGPGAFPPPVYSTDGGKTWRDVPVPSGFSASDGGQDFLGYRADSRGVTAWFTRIVPGRAYAAGQALGERTDDGGATWHTVSPGCPASGPCAWRIPALPYYGQRVLLLSTNGGKVWQLAHFAGHRLTGGQLYLGARGEILWAGADAGLSLGSGLSFLPLLRSTDGGRTWQQVNLPTPPSGWKRLLIPSSFGGVGYSSVLFATQDGALAVAYPPDRPSSWWVLRPGATAWISQTTQPTGLLSRVSN